MPENLSPLNNYEIDVNEPGEEKGARERTGDGLCPSGGGYRAMLFHLGSLWRFNELGLLPKLSRISSVSGGSITAALLGLAWKDLDFDSNGVARQFGNKVVDPIRRLAGVTIDVSSVIGGLLNPLKSISDNINQSYSKYLFGDATLQNFPDPPAPRFILNATNVQTGVLWRFSKPYMGDYRVGLTMNPNTTLALAVTASSAFPPFLSPVVLNTAGMTFVPDKYADLQRKPFTTKVILSDGGGYDNLGLETVFKRCETVLVSDAGAKIAAEEEPKSDWARHSYRMLEVVDNQVRSLRKRILLASYKNATCKGAYWGIRTDIVDYKLPSALNVECPHSRTLELAEVPTRLAKLSAEMQQRIINWGYAVCDASIRKYWPTAGVLTLPPMFPCSGTV